MNTIEKMSTTEQKNFDYQDWEKKFLDAQTYRLTCGWESKAEDAIRIRKNDLPLTPLRSMPGYQGKHYVDNWIHKGTKMLVSMLAGAAVDIDVKSYHEADSGSGILVEQEVNWAATQFDIQEAAEMALWDRYFPGFGVVRANWNAKRIQPNYKTGIPQFTALNPMNIWFDPGCNKLDRSDMRYLFHQEWFDTADLKRQFPKLAEKLTDQSDEKKSVWTDQVRLVTIQYRRTFTTDIVIIEDRHSGAQKEFPLDEWRDLVNQAASDPATSAAWQQAMMQAQEMGEPVIDYEEWLVQGSFLPEQVLMHGPLETEKDGIFQAIILPDQSMVIEEPRYVGDMFSYFILVGINDPDCAYPDSLAMRQADALEADIALMTSTLLQVVKTHRTKEIIQEGSLKNYDEYKEHGHELNVDPIVKESWQLEHEGTDAIKQLPTPDLPRAAMMLSDRLMQNQKSSSGAVDALMGMQSTSGQSGIQVAQLQTAARTYLREDIETYRRFLQNIITWLMKQIIRYRNYPHTIPGLQEDNTKGMVEVATDITNRLDTDEFYIQITLQDNAEVVKQIEREFYQYLVQNGMITPLSFMRKTDVQNPEKEIQDMQEWQGERQMIEMLRTIPGAAEMLTQYAQQYQQQLASTQPQGGAPNGPKAQ